MGEGAGLGGVAAAGIRHCFGGGKRGHCVSHKGGGGDEGIHFGGGGLWAEAPAPNFADYVLFVTPDRNRADFSIHYTKVRSFAGCKN